MVYAIKCKEYIKIGVTTDLNKRLNNLSTANPFPLELIYNLEGDETVEKEIHTKLDKYHHYKEWFNDCKEVRDLLNQYPSYKGEDSLREKRTYLNGKEMMFQLYLEKIANEHGVIYIPTRVRKQIINELQIHTTNISKYLKILIDVGMIEGSRGRYKLLRILK